MTTALWDVPPCSQLMVTDVLEEYSTLKMWAHIHPHQQTPTTPCNVTSNLQDNFVLQGAYMKDIRVHY
jgi:hypothetical protein